MAAFRSLAGFLVAALALTLWSAGAAGAVPVVIAPDGKGVVPFQVAIVFSSATTVQGEIFCGGTIRDPPHVITPGHCVEESSTDEPREIDVAAGFTNQAKPQATLQRRHVVAISSHPDFNTPIALDNDVAILTLDQPLDLSDPNVVAALPPAPAGETGTQALISGWGDTDAGGPFVSPDKLQEAIVDVLADSSCAGYEDAYDPAEMICAGRLLGNGAAVDTCQGDSGGPLARLTANDPQSADRLLGITSFGNGCGDASFPGIYTRVSGTSVNAFVTIPDPVARPAAAGPATITGTLAAGSDVHCAPGTWTGAPAFTFEFDRAPAGTDTSPSVVTQQGPSDTYRLTSDDAGHLIDCIVRGRNAGGTATTFSDGVGPIAAGAPGARAPPRGAGQGGGGAPGPPFSDGGGPTAAGPPAAELTLGGTAKVVGEPAAPAAQASPSAAAPVARDVTPPTSTFTRRHCAAARCDLLLLVSDNRGVGGVAVRATLARVGGRARPVRVRRTGPGRFTLAARRLRPGRYRFTARAVDAAGNHQRTVTRVVLRLPRG